MGKYRRRVDIIADILRIAADGARKTRIMYFANLSYSLLEKHLEQTINMGFVQANGEGYDVTERDRSFWKGTPSSLAGILSLGAS